MVSAALRSAHTEHQKAQKTQTAVKTCASISSFLTEEDEGGGGDEGDGAVSVLCLNPFCFVLSVFSSVFSF